MDKFTKNCLNNLLKILIWNGYLLTEPIFERTKVVQVGSPKSEAIAKSAGGNSTKIHMIVDAHGNPLDFLVSDGATHDVKAAPELIKKVELRIQKSSMLIEDISRKILKLVY